MNFFWWHLIFWCSRVCISKFEFTKPEKFWLLWNSGAYFGQKNRSLISWNQNPNQDTSFMFLASASSKRNPTCQQHKPKLSIFYHFTPKFVGTDFWPIWSIGADFAQSSCSLIPQNQNPNQDTSFMFLASAGSTRNPTRQQHKPKLPIFYHFTPKFVGTVSFCVWHVTICK